MSFFSNLFIASAEAQLVDKATDEMLIGPDWSLNMEIADAVALSEDGPAVSKEVVKALRKRLSHKDCLLYTSPSPRDS